MSLQRRFSFPVLLVAALGLAAAPASANSWRGHDGPGRGHGSHAEGRGHSGDRHGSKHDRRYDRKHDRRYDRYDRKHDRRYDRYDRKHAKHDYKHGKHYDKHAYKHAKRHHKHGREHYRRHYVTRHAHGYPVHHYGNAYYCEPCSHYFGSYDLLSHHAHHHHGVAWVQLPSLIFQASIGGGAGWAFGY